MSKKYYRVYLDKELEADKIEKWKSDGIPFSESQYLVCFYRIKPEYL